MKKLLFLTLTFCLCMTGFAQSCWWVFLTDKQGCTFDPYTYFDAKAIERYRLNHADLWDSTNYPLNEKYVQGVCALATEEVGQSRWFNAVAVMATAEQAAAIGELPYVRSVQPIEAEARISRYDEDTNRRVPDSVKYKAGMTKQLLRMQGELFREKGIDGRGIRIAVFDAGFPRVNSHAAFQHLRDSNRIIATWNFPKKKADVYGWSDHGTKVLSCITGIIDTLRLGLATGAEFLLARTEVEREPFKEEVWWMQAMEWADKNGADIISSSLGYGKDRYKVSQMDGRSYVARAANMAARKGMLVCNAAGNEGDDDAWKIIITPADADSVLTVGGIDNYLNVTEHAYFASYGPTTDGRLKPNVCNFSTVCAADIESDSTLDSWVSGTSFSTPLTAGFCACAWQMRRSLTAMQLKAEVERSANLYPYFDYALGYGVPQASWFTEETRKEKEPTFVLKDSAHFLMLLPVTKDSISGFHFFMHVRDSNGRIDKYSNCSFSVKYPADSVFPLYIQKTSVGANILCIHFNGYVMEYRLNDSDRVKFQDCYVADENIWVTGNRPFYDRDTPYEEVFFETEESDYNFFPDLSRTLADNKVDWWKGRFSAERDLVFGMMAGMGDEVRCKASSPSFYIGDNYLMQIGRPWYRVGVGYGFSHTNFNAPAQFGIASAAINSDWYRTNLDELSLQLFQRIRMMSQGRNGLFWDLGLYGSYGWTRDKVRFKTAPEAEASKQVLIRPDRLADYRWNYGVISRVNYRFVGIYARYRVKGLLGGELSHPEAVLPRLMLGVNVNFDRLSRFIR